MYFVGLHNVQKLLLSYFMLNIMFHLSSAVKYCKYMYHFMYKNKYTTVSDREITDII